MRSLLHAVDMVRIRLRFDSTPVHYARQCWFLFDPSSCRVVGDVAFLIAKHFGLTEAEGIQVTRGKGRGSRPRGIAHVIFFLPA